MKILIATLICSHLTFAKCMIPDDQQKVKDSKIIIVAKIRRANVSGESQKVQSYCENFGANKVPLRYLIEPVEILKGDIDKQIYELTYTFSCNRYPRMMGFKEGSSYVLSIKMLKNRKIFLSGNSCGSWGWDIKNLKKIKKLIAN